MLRVVFAMARSKCGLCLESVRLPYAIPLIEHSGTILSAALQQSVKGKLIVCFQRRKSASDFRTL